MNDFEWDPQKAKANYEKHGIRFADAASVLEDPNALTIMDDHPLEERFITLGADSLGKILVVVYTYRKLRYRIISARKATRNEISQYLEKLR